jgi:membrane fusion protein (multidrug efflux system)
MRSDFLAGRPTLRRFLPWLLWGVAAAVVIPLVWEKVVVGSAPAIVDTRVAPLSVIRTDHRLRVGKILVKPGQSVKAGDVLLQMDSAEIDAELTSARAKLVYVELIARWQEIRLRSTLANTSVTVATNAERAAIEAARIVAEAERDRSELAQLDVNLAMEEQLVGEQLVNAERLKELRLRRAALAMKVQEYRGAVTQARKSASGSTQRLGAWRKGSHGQDLNVIDGSSSIDRTSAQFAAGEVQRMEIKKLELLKSYLDLKSPFDGRVGDILIQVGQLAADPTIPMITIVEEHSKAAIAYASQTIANIVRVGDRAKLVPRDLSGPSLMGRVVALAPSITEIPIRFWKYPNYHEFGRNIYIELDKPADLPGMAFDAVFNRARGGAQ